MKLPELSAVPKWVWLAGAGLVGIIWMRGARAAARDATGAAVNAAAGAVEGTVNGIGAAIGIPETDAAKCQAAQLAGDALDVSAYCPAADAAAWAWETAKRAVSGAIRPAVKPAQKSRVLTPQESQWPYVPVEDLTGSGCVGGVCGPSFEGQSQSQLWNSNGALIYPSVADASDTVIRRYPDIVPVIGMRG